MEWANFKPCIWARVTELAKLDLLQEPMLPLGGWQEVEPALLYPGHQDKLSLSHGGRWDRVSEALKQVHGFRRHPRPQTTTEPSVIT